MGTLIESWNGATWSIVPSPSAGTTQSTLESVSCPSATSCTAVGFYVSAEGQFQSLVETWNGTAWSVTPSPDEGAFGNVLSGVDCTTASSCTAVGEYYPSGTTDQTQTLVESWDGTSWTIVASPSEPATSSYSPSSGLVSVSCVSLTECTAVGSYTTEINFTQGDEPLVESWDGTSWSIATSPTPSGTEAFLSGVSCSSNDACAAVGGSAGGTLAETWDGSSWSIVQSPGEGTWSTLASVSCLSGTECTAVGNYRTSSATNTLVESWNGSTWAIEGSPEEGTGGSVLSSVSCPSADACQAAGYFYGPTGQQTLDESWNGTDWTTAVSPNPVSDNDHLTAISCTSPNACIAVGYYLDPAGAEKTLIESWNGRAWTVVPSPNMGSYDGLDGVSCTSPTACFAVGFYTSGGPGGGGLIESWNGSSWSIVSNPYQGSSPSSLHGITCASSNACTAVGSYVGQSGVDQTLVESWNGELWTVSISPNSGSGENVLNSVSCTSLTQCSAVGYYLNTQSVPQALTESFNGVIWTVQSSPDPGPTTDVLSAVSCRSAKACTAVGYDDTGSGGSATQQALVESWNGSVWTAITSPEPGRSYDTLNGVSCSSSVSCTAVGGYTGTAGIEQTLLEAWNGSTWTVVASPDDGTGSNQLAGVSCLSSGACSSAGTYQSGNSILTLVEANH